MPECVGGGRGCREGCRAEDTCRRGVGEVRNFHGKGWGEVQGRNRPLPLMAVATASTLCVCVCVYLMPNS